MRKTKKYIVSSIFAVYLSLIGANLIWQQSDGVSGANLSAGIYNVTQAEIDECGPDYQPRTALLNTWYDWMVANDVTECFNWMACESQDKAWQYCETVECGGPCHGNCTHKCVFKGDHFNNMIHGLRCCRAAIDKGVVSGFRTDCGGMPTSPTACGSGGGGGGDHGAYGEGGSSPYSRLSAEQAAQIAAELAAANEKTNRARIAAQNQAAEIEATQQARAAQEAIQTASKTEKQKEEEYQSNANEIALCRQKPEACVTKPAIGPTYKAQLDEIKKQKKQAEVMEGVGVKIQAEAEAKQAEAARIRSEVNFASKWELPLSAETVAAAEKLQKESADDCIANMTALSDKAVAAEAALEEQTASQAVGIISENGEQSIGSDDAEPVDIDSDKLIADAITKEQERQAAIQEACAELTAAANTVAAGSKNYAALLANLDNLSSGLDITLARQSDAISADQIATTQAIEDQQAATAAARLQQVENAITSQLTANQATADAALAEGAGPAAIPIGFSNVSESGERIVPIDSDVIPIIPVPHDGNYLVPSWDYSFGGDQGSEN